MMERRKQGGKERRKERREEWRKGGREGRKEKRKKPPAACPLLAPFRSELLKMLNSDSTLQLSCEIDSLIQSLLWELFLKFFFLAVLGLHCCVRAFSSCGELGLLFVAVRGLLTAVASLVVEHGL